MTDALATVFVPVEVEEFAADKGIAQYLDSAIELARQAFPSSVIELSLGRDAEDESHRYVALDVAVGGRSTDELLASQRVWSEGLGRACPSRHAVYFVLGWR